MEEKLQNSISTKQLYKEYDWYQNTFPLPIQEACDDFLDNKFKLGFIGLSKNINCLLENEPCFVTKIKLDNEHDVFFRLTDKAVNVILNNTLGQSKNKFNINKISQLEARIITSFNDFIFEKIKSELAEPDPTLLRRDDFNMIHLTFVIKAKDSQNPLVGKFIITLPQVLLKPEEIISSGETFDEENFPQCETFAKAFIGKTKFSLYDIKHLENDDVVVFENSQTNSIKITIDNENLDVNLNPNMEILIPDIESGGSDMVDTHQDIWDSIEVEMSAEIESVKITLGELKNIESGLVVDLASLYDNKVTLTVEGKPIANGALVIVNDRYGVKIDEVFAQNEIKNKSNPNESAEEKEEIPPPEESEEETQAPKEGSEDEEFDYSDFELEDENI